MAYSPIERKTLAQDARLIAFARRYGVTPAQVAIAWLLRNDDIIVIPKASNRQHLVENIQALDFRLTREQLVELDAMFPPPDGPQTLQMH
jgi:diketogulonate reductase-like aldo/keto reductase